jgi:pimeloyl-ACP methyl ester carboxylesterase
MRLSPFAIVPALLLAVTPLLAGQVQPGGTAGPTPASDATRSAASPPLPRRAGPLGVRVDPEATDRVVVSEVGPGTTAAAAGIVAGDTLVAVAGRPVTTMDGLRAALRGVFAGQTIRIDVIRQGAPLALQVTLAQRREPVEGSTVSYRSVEVPNGYRLRTIVTVPDRAVRARGGRHPALLYVQGITCDSVDRPERPDAADTRIVHALARQGFVTLRVDKPGLGDSEGPPCHDIGFAEELDGYRAALGALAAMPEVDPGRVYVFGYSMGGLMAPYLARDGRVRGSIVYGTLVRTWFEYQLENARRQSELAGRSPAEVTEEVLQQAKESATILIDKKSLGDVWRRWPELRQEPQGLMLSETHIATRSMKFFHELQDLNLARAWHESSGAVLAIHGEYDWVSALEDHRRIADIANARTPGSGAVLTLPQLDHGFTRHASLQDSFRSMGQGAWESGLPDRMLAWIDSVEGAAAPARPQLPGVGADQPPPGGRSNR